MSVTPNADTNPPHHLTDVGEMVFNFLDSHGYDGLANLREECGCGFKPDAQEVTPNFPPCGNFNPNCRPAFLVTFPREHEGEGSIFVNAETREEAEHAARESYPCAYCEAPRNGDGNCDGTRCEEK